ncbi:MAG: cell wall metabolism sensor histidine kinase WalK [Clostridiales Family XIII bacterium]|jgi:two-component system sensor histidine kinase VicK|nr:cell wall metabolism sensor histidine kinase WalK [Clostridiales Family XIII bacterium]
MSRFSVFRSIQWKIVILIFFLLLCSSGIVWIFIHFKVDLFIALIVGIAVPLLLGIFFSKIFSQPLQNIVEKTHLMLNGDFSKPIKYHSRDEIGRLASMYNALRKKLNENFSEITSEKEKLETVLRQMADGMLAVDLSGRFIHVNEAAQAMLRISEDDMRYKRYDDIILRFSDALTLTGILTDLENEISEGRFSYGGAAYNVRYDLFRDINGQIGGVVISLQDITEQQKIDHMQIDFVANVSHELKTPLTSIKGYTETLLEGGLDDPVTAREFLGIINSETDRMNRMVKDLLQLSRLDTHQQKFEMREGNIIKLTDVAMKKVEMMAKGKQQFLNRLFDPEMTIVLLMDRDRMEQVVLNILSNAIKYTGVRGRIDVDVFVSRGRVHIVVADNGIGIPETELTRVFERFFRVDRSRSAQNIAGTGLGLPISKQIVEGHGGSIELESHFGKGTKVSILLPVSPLPFWDD